MENTVTRFLKFAATAVVLLGSASLALAQDGRSRAGAFQNDGYSAYGSAGHSTYGSAGYNASRTIESGPYSPPRRVTRVPAQKVLPFTWEEKRHFDQSNGEQG
jgi:hypothetical protein